MSTIRNVLIALFLFGLCACGARPPLETAASPAPTTQFLPVILSTTVPTTTIEIDETEITPTPEPIVYGRTYHQADGNHFVAGQGDLAALVPLDIGLDGRPEWVVSAPFGEGVLWVTVLEDGRVQAFAVMDDVVNTVPIAPESVPAGQPPLLVIEQGVPRLLVVDGMSAVTHPVPVGDGIAYVDTAGNLIISQNELETTLPVNALPDTRIVTDEQGRLLLLTMPDTSYPHGVLGDAVEAKSVTLIETMPEPRIVREIVMEADWVIEGVAPLWVDWDGDGVREIIVTRTNRENGAQIVMYDEDGEWLAAGPMIGRGFRWRHQLAVAPFGANGTMQLVDVLTPHIGGRVEFYAWRDGALTIETAVSGYTSHVIGTRNLDMAVAGDWIGSGGAQLLLPSQDRTVLGVVGMVNGVAAVILDVSVAGQVVTNLAAVAHHDGLAVGVGRADSTLRIWQR